MRLELPRERRAPPHLLTPSKETAAARGEGDRRQCNQETPAGYFFGRMSPVCRYRVWKAKASLNMCGEWRPALGFFMARLT
jgi:hypothetical protein